MDLASLKQRINDLLALSIPEDYHAGTARYHELLQGALTVMSIVHGAESHQVAALKSLSQFDLKLAPRVYSERVRGALTSLKAEVDMGLAGSLQKKFYGEAITDFLQLARISLDAETEQGKNIAAVLVAATFEDTLRRMAADLTGLTARDDLQNVLTALKNNGILVPPQLGIAQSYLSFRNKALHAEWERIDRAGVESILAFVQQLLLKHFS